MAWSSFIFCIPDIEESFLIASNFGASALRMGSTSTSCCGVSFSCCAKAIAFSSAAGFWAGAVGARVRNARKQAADVRSVKGFVMAAIYLAMRDSPMGLKSYKQACGPLSSRSRTVPHACVSLWFATAVRDQARFSAGSLPMLAARLILPTGVLPGLACTEGSIGLKSYYLILPKRARVSLSALLLARGWKDSLPIVLHADHGPAVLLRLGPERVGKRV